jgi:CheY-like chemotaxis protein/phosphoribosyl 1,2-cyclic phosphodiesterase
MGKRIVVVEDEETVRELLVHLLEAAGCEVRSFPRADLALADVRSQPPDCVLTDLMMPGMDGIELTRAIRADERLARCEVVVLSAKAWDSDRDQALRAGARSFFTKPLKPRTFASRLLELLEDSAEIGFWGVRGTMPATGEGTLRYGGDTSCVTVSRPGRRLVVFDAGSGIRKLGASLMASGERVEAAILITHPHWDHINALPFFTPLYPPGNDFLIAGARQGELGIRDLLAAQMDGVFFPVKPSVFNAHIEYRDLAEESFELDGWRVDTMLLSHPGACLGYRLRGQGKTFCYITDNELFLPGDPRRNEHYVGQLTEFVRGADLLVTDTTYTDDEYQRHVSFGHSCVSEVIKLAHAAEVQTLALFHHDPSQDDAAIDRKLAAAQQRMEQLGGSTRIIAPAQGSVLAL